MREPALVCLSGHTYDRAHLNLWHASSSGREPVTRQRFELTDVAPNLALRELIDEWIKDYKSRQLEEEGEEEEEEEGEEEKAEAETEKQEESAAAVATTAAFRAQVPSLEVQQSPRGKQVGPSTETCGDYWPALNSTGSSVGIDACSPALPEEEDIESAFRALERSTGAKEQQKTAAAQEDWVVVKESASMVAGSTDQQKGDLSGGGNGGDCTKQTKVEVDNTEDAVKTTKAQHSAGGATAVAAGAALALGGAIIVGGLVVKALRPQVMHRYTLDALDSACDMAGHVEEIIEYQRKVPFKGFSASHLFPNEPEFKRGNESNLAQASKEDLMLPVGWRWSDDWCVVTGSAANAPGTDKDGWMYAFNWGTDYAASVKVTHCVRRRIWKRTRERLEE